LKSNKTLTAGERFNPRAREGRDFTDWREHKADRCFNPRAREGRDFFSDFTLTLHIVSIHAPAKGATQS